MEIILISVTALSVGLTALLSVLLLRLTREERRRSDARVRLLSELAGSENDLELHRPEDASVRVGSLFDEHHAPSPWPRRLAGAGAFALAVALAAFGWSFVDTGRTLPSGQTSSASSPLELLSLTHQQDKDALTITGVVQNPRGAGPRANVEATALVFDAKGTLLASGRTPLDFATLPPGDESPFVIRVNATGVVRYRVGFRSASGQALPHVDRRTLDAVARKESP